MINIMTAISIAADNTLIGTLCAGLLIAVFSLKLYRKQKEVDILFTKKEKIRELATSLLTNINVAVKDYIGQVSVHDGSNPHAKVILDRLNELSPGQAYKDRSVRFEGYVSSITKSLDALSTPLALDRKNETRVMSLAETIPKLTLLFSMVSTLSGLPNKTLKDVSSLCKQEFDKVRGLLENIIENP